MSGNYSYVADYNQTTAITRTVTSTPLAVSQFQDDSGIRFVLSVDQDNNRWRLVQISGTDGIVDDQSTITSYAAITKTVGTSPRFASQFQDDSGIRWVVSADFNSNRWSLVQISGTDGIVDDQSTITSNTAITKTVGNGPIFVNQFQDSSGIRWVVSADLSSNQWSLVQISPTTGIVDDQATITGNTAITKAVGTNPRTARQFQDTSGIRWILSSDSGSNQFSLVQISPTTGIVSNQATITANTAITKAVGASPISLDEFQDSSGIRWVVIADGLSRWTLLQISGEDGIVYGQTAITASPLLPKSTGATVVSVDQFQDSANSRWILSLSQTALQWSLTQISGNSTLAFTLSNVTIDVTNRILTAENIAELSASLVYFNFVASISSGVDAYFNYTISTNASGIVESGGQLRLINSTADILDSSGITVASGATVRLGKKATYTIDFFFQNGSTLEVFPDSDRGGDTLDLLNCTLASGATVNATSGTATVLVPSTTGVTAGTGVSLVAPQVAFNWDDIEDGTRVVVNRYQTFAINSADINTTTNAVTLGVDAETGATFAGQTTTPATLFELVKATGATLPTTTPQLVNGNAYYCLSNSSGVVTISESEGGTAVDFTTTGTESGGALFTLIARTELINEVTSGGISEALTLPEGAVLEIYARGYDTTTATEMFLRLLAWSTTAGAYIADTFSLANNPDRIFNALIGSVLTSESGRTITVVSDPSDVTGLGFDLTGNIELDANAITAATISAPDAYVWMVLISYTEAGARFIRAQFTAQSVMTYTLDKLRIDNIADGTRNSPATPLNIIGNLLTADPDAEVFADGSGTVRVIPFFVTDTTSAGDGSFSSADRLKVEALYGTLESSGETTEVFTAEAVANVAGGGGGDATAANQTTIINALAVVDGIVDAILADTAEIGAAGAGLTEAGGTGDHLTAIPAIANVSTVGTVTNAVTTTVTPLDATATQAAAAAALTAYDPPTRADLTSDIGTVTTAIADVPTVAEFEARTLPSADYFVVGDYTAPDNASIAAILTDTGTTIPSTLAGLLTSSAYTASLPPNFGALAITAGGAVTTSNPGGGATAAQVWEYSGGDRSLSGTQSTNIAAISSLPSVAQVQAAGFTTDRDNALFVDSRRKRIDYAASTYTFYAADGVTPLYVLDLQDADGNPATTAQSAVDSVPQ